MRKPRTGQRTAPSYINCGSRVKIDGRNHKGVYGVTGSAHAHAVAAAKPLASLTWRQFSVFRINQCDTVANRSARERYLDLFAAAAGGTAGPWCVCKYRASHSRICGPEPTYRAVTIRPNLIIDEVNLGDSTRDPTSQQRGEATAGTGPYPANVVASNRSRTFICKSADWVDFDSFRRAWAKATLSFVPLLFYCFGG